MLCPKCKIETINDRDDKNNWVAKCKNPKCQNYGKTVEVIIQAEQTSQSE